MLKGMPFVVLDLFSFPANPIAKRLSRRSPRHSSAGGPAEGLSLPRVVQRERQMKDRLKRTICLAPLAYRSNEFEPPVVRESYLENAMSNAPERKGAVSETRDSELWTALRSCIEAHGDRPRYEHLSLEELQESAAERGVDGVFTMSREELVARLRYLQ